MGRSVTPTFRIEARTMGFVPTFHMAWPKQAGRPSTKTAEEYVRRFNASLEPGGCNEHLKKSCPMARMLGVKVVRQSTGAVVASYDLPMFEVV